MKKKCYFSLTEIILFIISEAVITASFFAFSEKNYLAFIASLIGVASLILNAKGNPAGQALMVVFGVCYGIISIKFRYWGEMITYMGMSVPMSVLSLVSWLKNPYNGKKSEVKVNEISPREYPLALLLTAAVTFVFYFILKAFNTANLIWSTVSVATSFIAVYFTFRRSPLFALGYAANDVVLVVLWILAALENSSYFSLVACFSVFLINDIYGFISWCRLKKRQNENGGEVCA